MFKFTLCKKRFPTALVARIAAIALVMAPILVMQPSTAKASDFSDILGILIDHAPDTPCKQLCAALAVSCIDGTGQYGQVFASMSALQLLDPVARETVCDKAQHACDQICDSTNHAIEQLGVLIAVTSGFVGALGQALNGGIPQPAVNLTMPDLDGLKPIIAVTLISAIVIVSAMILATLCTASVVCGVALALAAVLIVLLALPPPSAMAGQPVVTGPTPDAGPSATTPPPGGGGNTGQGSSSGSSGGGGQCCKNGVRGELIPNAMGELKCWSCADLGVLKGTGCCP